MAAMAIKRQLIPERNKTNNPDAAIRIEVPRSGCAATNKVGQIAMGLVVMLVMAQIPPRVYESWAPYLYFVCVILLVLVDAFGQISKGAQRWLDLGFIRFQPSEIAKIAVPLMVARFMNRDVCPPSLKNTGIALILIFMPTLLWPHNPIPAPLS